MKHGKILLPLFAGLLAFLTVAGGGTAYALWTAHAEARIGASTATIGATTSDLSASGLSVGYNQADEVYADAGAVSITNTGSREAWYGVTVTVQDQSVSGLRDVIRIGATVVASAAACTPAAMPLDTLSSGSWSWRSSGASPAQLAPGDSAILCIVTWLPETDISAFGSTSIDLAIEPSLAYTDPVSSPDADWVATGDFDADAPGAQPLVAHQTVTTQDLALLFDNPVGRYWISNAYADGSGTLVNQGEVCKGGSLEMPARFDGITACSGDAWNSQWRLVPVPGHTNVWWILQATNSYDQPTTPRWTITSLTDAITDQAPNNSDENQMWTIEGRGDGTYRIKALSRTTAGGDPVCITVSAAGRGSYGQLPNSTSILVPGACSGTAASQGFRFDLIGHPVPSTVLDANGHQSYPNGYPLSCTDSIYYRTFTWASSTGYEGEVHYRVYFDDIEIADYTNGYSTVAPIGGADSAGVQAWWNAHGSGAETSAQVVVQQQITDLGSWTAITQPLTVWVDHNGTNNNPVYCTRQAPTTPPGGSPTTVAATCSQSGGWYWAVGWPAPSNQAGSRFRIAIDSTVLPGSELDGYQTSFGSSAQNAPFPSLVGSRILTVQISTDGGGTWTPYATLPVTITDTPGGNPEYYLSC